MHYLSLKQMPQELVKDYIYYNDLTGEFKALKPDYYLRKRTMNGRLYICLKGQPEYVPASKLAWYYMTGVWANCHVVVIDGNIHNLAYKNLGLFGVHDRLDYQSISEYTAQQAAIEASTSLAEQAKVRLDALNAHGTGISFHTLTNKWRARVTLNSEQRTIGADYASEEEATAALRGYLTNLSLYTTNDLIPKSPRKGVSWNRKNRRWRVQYKGKYYGEYESVDMAIAKAQTVYGH